MPVPAMIQATTAPATPVSRAKRLGKEKTPAPTMDPMTIAVSVPNESLVAVDGPCSTVASEALTPMRSPRRRTPSCRQRLEMERELAPVDAERVHGVQEAHELVAQRPLGAGNERARTERHRDL